MAVGAGTRAAAASLNAQEVVEHGDHEVVVQVSLVVANGEAHDREAPGVGIAQDLDVGVFAPGLDGPADKLPLAKLDVLVSHRFLELKNQTRADGLDDGRSAAFFAMSRIG